MRVRFCLALFVLSIPAAAQAPGTITPANIPALQLPQPMLRRILRDSGRIFAGTVTNVQHIQGGTSVPITRVTFRIDEAIRGVRKGQSLQISEWGGLWQTGERYRTGEHVLLFLFPQSKLGLTSPVAGALGRWSIQADKNQAKPVGTHLEKSQLKSVAALLRQAVRE